MLLIQIILVDTIHCFPSCSRKFLSPTDLHGCFFAPNIIQNSSKFLEYFCLIKNNFVKFSIIFYNFWIKSSLSLNLCLEIVFNCLLSCLSCLFFNPSRELCCCERNSCWIMFLSRLWLERSASPYVYVVVKIFFASSPPRLIASSPHRLLAQPIANSSLASVL